MKKLGVWGLYLGLLFALAAPAPALANGWHGGGAVSVGVSVAFGGFGYRRPICPIGDVGPGCVAPVRKAFRALGRGIRNGFRGLFGRGFCY